MHGHRSPSAAGRIRWAAAAERPSFAVHADLMTGRLTVIGGLGALTAHLLHDGVSTMLATDRSRWTVDVSHLDVVDQAGLRAIAGSYRRALLHERQIVLHGASPSLRRALARLRLERHVLPAECVSQGGGPD